MNLSDFGRFSDPALLILSSLADGPKHGYAMMSDIETLTGIRLGPGTLYGALARLEGAGLIQSLPAEDRRRPYQLTAKGATALHAQLSLLQRLAATGLERLAVS
jgi:DNA-binding PadR family transcriptional regulator